MISVREAFSQLSFLRLTLATTTSKGKAPSTNTTLPSSRCAMPCASKSMDSMCSHWGGFGAGASVMWESSCNQEAFS